METPNPHSLRVLIRPSSSSSSPSTSTIPTSSSTTTTTTTTSTSTSSTNLTNPPLQKPSPLRLSSFSSLPLSSSSSASSPSQSASPSSEGVIVVGFIGRNSDDVTYLINRILDANVFGSGNLDKHLEEKENKGSFRLSYYYEEEKGIVFLHFQPSSSFLSGLDLGDSSLDSILEENESEDLKGMLLMFSVCHVIVHLHEGSRFDTQILKKFRMLQAAKNTLAPFMKSNIAPMLTSKASSSSSSQPTALTTTLNSSPSRGGGITSRHASAISLMSGSGSSPSLFPGQCTPVILFVFLDDFLDGPSPGFQVEDLADVSSSNQSSSLNGTLKPSVPMKGSSSVVMLSRQMSKTEGSFRKKVQSSLEAQIRFLIKKCRTLAGTEANHSGTRGGVNVNSLPLFSLDPSRAVALLDRSTNHKGESLDFITGLVEEVLNANASSDIFLLENHSQSANKEDILSIKEFIYRHSDTLRGKGGLAGNTNSGSAAGVGMVAIAAAAAAASAASGKSFSTTPELPTLDSWLSSCRLIIDALLSPKCGPQVDGVTLIGANAVEGAISWLDSGRGLNMKFSVSWCQRVLPSAKAVYLRDLPPCYPTTLHETQLGKAMRAFNSMVKGPAVQMFAKKLEDECLSIWKSGRQLCDAVSLTGKPCVHQRHKVETDALTSQSDVKPHSSGHVFLHACACGRSRQFRDDPFDFESANVKFNCFPNCENLLPALALPKTSDAGPFQASSWSLVRVGGAKYYEPSKGLLQSGFCSNEKLLLRWTIFLEKLKETDGSGVTRKGFIIRSPRDPNFASITGDEIKKGGASPEEIRTGGLENQRKLSENISSNDPKISFGRGLPSFAMKKPFSEVVAGSIAADLEFPPLQQRRQTGLEKGIKKRVARDRIEDQVHVSGDYQTSQKSDDISGQESSLGPVVNFHPDGDPFLKIGSNVVPVNVSSGGRPIPDTSLKHVVVYIGFEYECSYGHRFVLSPELLNECSSISVPEEHHISSTENSDRESADSLILNKNGTHEKVHPHPVNLTKEKVANSNQHWDGRRLFAKSEKEQNESATGIWGHSKSVDDLDGSLHYATLDDKGSAFSLLNRNLPIYMNCPHCRICSSKGDRQKIKFASTISQLQRIFMVTPPFPIVLATCPVVQFEASCLPSSALDREKQSQFSLGCRVILPPESFLTFRLPFVYGVQLEDRSLYPLKHFEHLPELTAWITKGTVLQVVSKGSNINEEIYK
ncbi:uncharacterized protein LOC143892451 [Tasmannia lanceolata]|uniref:uncharacterized protein LOC143892451 n=1 Tax=Tasmannia lanceolata TaxID=3420 RepID=UPI00406345DA